MKLREFPSIPCLLIPAPPFSISRSLLLAGTLMVSMFSSLQAEESSKDQAPEKAKESKQVTSKELITFLLSQDLGVRKFSFAEVIHASSGKLVTPVDLKIPAHRAIIEAIEKSVAQSTIELSATDSPVRKLRRINEASRYFEDSLLEKINSTPQFSCTIPRNTQGRQQRSGYPDLIITFTATDGTKTFAYLDPKLYEEKSRASSLRSFYYEPRTRTNKVQYDALHLLVGICHDGRHQAWQFTRWELCDLSQFSVRLKAEFQASNRDLYQKKHLIQLNPKN